MAKAKKHLYSGNVYPKRQVRNDEKEKVSVNTFESPSGDVWLENTFSSHVSRALILLSLLVRTDRSSTMRVPFQRTPSTLPAQMWRVLHKFGPSYPKFREKGFSSNKIAFWIFLRNFLPSFFTWHLMFVKGHFHNDVGGGVNSAMCILP